MKKSHPGLSDAEFQAAKEAFMIYDKDGSDSLDVAETGQLLRALGMTPTFVQVREIIREFDKDKNGTLSFDEFLNLYAKHKAPPASSKELLEAFKVFDAEGNGKISCQELSTALTTLGDPLPAVQVSELIKTLDKGNTGHIDIAEFVAFLTKAN